MGRLFKQFTSHRVSARSHPAPRRAISLRRSLPSGTCRAWTAACLLGCAGPALAQAGPAQASASAAAMLATSETTSAAATAASALPQGGAPAAAAPEAPRGLLLGLGSGARGWSRGIAPRWSSELAPRSENLPAVSIVTLPPDLNPGRAPGRAHHALSVRSEMPRQALRSLGFDVTECATRFRMPTRLRQDSPGGDTTLETQAQVSWACRF